MNIEEIKNTIINANCVDVMKEMPDNCIDAIVTDPPYELGFMGKAWDKSGIANSVEMWRECLRILKPGGHLLSFGGTRTYHRMACAIEDAGFQVRDMINWCYGSGFPKSLNIGKAVDAMMGNERVVVRDGFTSSDEQGNTFGKGLNAGFQERKLTTGQSPWEGFGTALKPAHEPICMARKPLDGTVAENCLKWGCGGLDIDGCRVGFQNGERESLYRPMTENRSIGWKNTSKSMGYNTDDGLPPKGGRFPANLCHDGSEEVLACFPETAKGVASGYNFERGNQDNPARNVTNIKSGIHFGDSGSAARFFQFCPVCIEDIEGSSLMYHAKASKAERNIGCDGLEKKQKVFNGQSQDSSKDKKDLEGRFTTQPTQNSHPTVKSYNLMQNLVKLVSREGHTVLDPFAGSGTTLMACKKLGRNYIGIDLEPDHVTIAKCRVDAVKREQTKKADNKSLFDGVAV